MKKYISFKYFMLMVLVKVVYSNEIPELETKILNILKTNTKTFQALNKQLVDYLIEQNKVLESNVQSILNITEEKELQEVEKELFSGHKGPILSLIKLQDETLATGSTDSTIKIWNLTNGSVIKTFKEHVDSVTTLVLLNNGLLVSGSKDGTIKVWNTSSNVSLYRSITLQRSSIGDEFRTVRSIIATKDDLLVCGTSDGIDVFNLNFFEPLIRKLEFPLHLNFLNKVKTLTSLNNDLFAAGTMDSIVIWNLTNNSPVLEIKQRYEPSLKMSLVLLPDESLASALPSQDFNIRIWNTTTGLLIREITTKERVLALAVIQNGNLASSQTDETIKIYDLNTSECIRTLTGHTANINMLSVSKDGRLFSASTDKQIKIWLPNNGELIRTLE